MNVPAGIASVVTAAQSGNCDPLYDAYRAATPVFDVPVLRAIGATSPDGLYPRDSVGRPPVEAGRFKGRVPCLGQSVT